LASGQRTAKFIGGSGDGENLKKVTDEPRFDFEPVKFAEARRKRFIPAGATLLVRRTVETLGHGIIDIPDSVKKEQPLEGDVLEVGPEATYAEDAHVVFGKYSGTLFILNGEELLLLQNDEVLGTTEDEVVLAKSEAIVVDWTVEQENLNIGVCVSPRGV
jgi:co-chaperonin GroES (HSP10)